VIEYTTTTKYKRDGNKFEGLSIRCPLSHDHNVGRAPLTDMSIPEAVSLSVNKCEPVQNYIAVTIPERPKHKQMIVACVPVSYGTIEPTLFYEWIELSKLLGISEFHIYNGNLTDKSLAMIRNYTAFVDDNKLQLKQIVFPFDSVKRKYFRDSKNVLAGHTSINDCVLRNMHRFKYVLVIDFDEVIIPYKEETLVNLISRISNNRKIQYVFPMGRFWYKCNIDRTEMRLYNDSYYFSTFYREPINIHSKAPKSIVDIQLCKIFSHHGCIMAFRQDPLVGSLLIDGHKMAFVHHYKTPVGVCDCICVNKNVKVDKTILKYEKQIQPIVKDLIDRLL